DEEVQRLRHPQRQHVRERLRDEEQLLVGPVLAQRHEARQHQRDGDGEQGGAQARQHQRPRPAQEGPGPLGVPHRVAPSGGGARWGRRPGTGWLTPSAPNTSSRWQAVSVGEYAPPSPRLKYSWSTLRRSAKGSPPMAVGWAPVVT